MTSYLAAEESDNQLDHLEMLKSKQRKMEEMQLKYEEELTTLRVEFTKQLMKEARGPTWNMKTPMLERWTLPTFQKYDDFIDPDEHLRMFMNALYLQ